MRRKVPMDQAQIHLWSIGSYVPNEPQSALSMPFSSLIAEFHSQGGVDQSSSITPLTGDLIHSRTSIVSNRTRSGKADAAGQILSGPPQIFGRDERLPAGTSNPFGLSRAVWR